MSSRVSDRAPDLGPATSRLCRALFEEDPPPDPRWIFCFLGNALFCLVYLDARERNQDQAFFASYASSKDSQTLDLRRNVVDSICLWNCPGASWVPSLAVSLLRCSNFVGVCRFVRSRCLAVSLDCVHALERDVCVPGVCVGG